MVNINQDIGQLKAQVGDLPEELTIGIWEYIEDIWTEELSTVVSNYTITLADSFIFGHPSGGVFGTNKWGVTISAPSIIRVINPSNTFRERFRDDDFEHANTATWDTTNFLAYFGDNEILETEIIALNVETYSTATVTLIGSAISNLTSLQIQFDGTNWESITHNVLFNSSYASTSGIKFKATAGTAHSNKFALSFPMSFAGTDIRSIKIEYS